MNAKIEEQSVIYKQIEVHLREEIEKGLWPIGAMLPGRRALAQRYGVSSLTVERAVHRLVADGILRSDSRRGTFIARSAPAPDERDGESHDARRSQEAVTIGIVASNYLSHHDHLELNNFWVRLIIQSLEQAFSQAGHATRFFNRVPDQGWPVEPLPEMLRTAIADGVDALVVIAFGSDPSEVDDSLAFPEEQSLPIVCITAGALHRPTPHVFYDNYRVGYQAARHLLQRGHRDIIFYSPFVANWAQERFEGIRMAAEHAGLPASAVRFFPETNHAWVQEEDPLALGYDFAAGLLRDLPSGGGVIAANDGVALGLLQAAEERGLDSGRDLMIVGFDDHPQARAAGLTSVRPPMEAMGNEAARLLLQTLLGERSFPQMRMSGSLIPRKSTVPGARRNARQEILERV